MLLHHSYSTDCSCESYVTEISIDSAWNAMRDAFEGVKLNTNLAQEVPDKSETWMWSNQFFGLIAQAEEDIANGRVQTYTTVEDMIDGLNAE